ncbi:MAG: hypothetical protein ACK4TC_10770 [Sphingomonas pseudosanguinis]|uniref:hypothetical protein n=1 Tax=Sphingomonas pseudosanguinis TaxID=413712 RepID=UPI00391ADD57
MRTDFPIEPAPQTRHIYVGQDRAGHWLVQDSVGMLEGRFVSRGAAMRFAAEEADLYHASVTVADEALVPLVSFDPVAADARALAHAA